ncbi:MAG: flagellar basal body rod protein FlgC [Planctomycetota bacterium]|jgi:flagellar basal-body rod protein FlgC|nr:flagellar basal body rod protein FlgC [Planctomycetota bacterium]
MAQVGGIFTSFDIAASALRAERARMNVHANNLANVNTIHDRYGENNPYHRKLIAFKPGNPSMTGSEYLGVEVDSIIDDYDTDLQRRYMPNHPDADLEGYVKFPNVNPTLEMVDMMVAQRAFEANLTSFEAAKTIFTGALRIIA